jgi:hypothetical protein
MNILPLIIVLIIAIVLIRQALMKKNGNNGEIYADHDILVKRYQTFQWKDIVKAYLIKDNEGRTADKFLLLDLNGGNIRASVIRLIDFSRFIIQSNINMKKLLLLLGILFACLF